MGEIVKYHLEVRESIESMAAFAREQMFKMSFQLTVWLMIGNGGGLYWVLSSAAAEEIRPSHGLAWVYLAFECGAAFAFAGLFCSVIVGAFVHAQMQNLPGELLGMQFRADLAERLEAQGKKPSAEHERQDTTGVQKIQATLLKLKSLNRIILVPAVFGAMSAIALLIGLSAPFELGFFRL